MKFIIISTVCISIFYIVYRILLRNEINFQHLRIYLLLSIFISVTLPLSNFTIDLGLEASKTESVMHSTVNQEIVPVTITKAYNVPDKQESFLKSVNWFLILQKVYRIIAVLLISRLLIQFLYLCYKFWISKRVTKGKNVFLYNHGFKNSFSFFNWIFIANDGSSEEDLQKIIAHELIHAKQFHSIDLLFAELLSAVMWFNPLVWMMRNSIQLLHEYLADEGVLKSGVDKNKYQALLVNLVSEEKLISISSSFNKSLIKKRMIMMNKIKLNKQFSAKVLAIIPVAILLFVGVACVNERNAENKTREVKETQEVEPKSNNEHVAAVELSKMNVVYVGIENPVKIAVSGYKSSEIRPTITNAYIKHIDKGDYVINPRRPGNCLLNIWSKDSLLEQKFFRANALPDPILWVGGKNGGYIKKDVLLAQDKVEVMMPNFDFDLEFKVINFTVSTTDKGGFYIEARSESDRITDVQKEIIKNATDVSRINFEDIKAIGPDGSIRELAPILFQIVK